MRRVITLIVVLAFMASMAVVGVSSAFAPINSSIRPKVLREWIKRPNPERVVKKFVPTGTPSVDYVRNVIVPYEAKRYHTDGIWDRVWCESSGIYNNGNGTYSGLIATNGVYWQGAWTSVLQDRDLGVKLKDKKRVTRNVYRVRLWTSGYKTYKKIGVQHVRRIVIRKGELPKNAEWIHGWAAIRVGTRAVAGVGPTTYWVCTHNGSNY